MPARQIAVQRRAADDGAEPQWQTYSVEVRDSQTVLDALLRVADEVDPTLAFRRTCRSGICGSCAGRVNGRPCLLCQLTIGEAAAGRPEAPIRVQPLAGFTVLRDLVVDMGPFFDAFDRAGAWLVPRPEYDGVLPAALAAALWPAMTCVMCGICAKDSQTATAPHAAVVSRVLTLARDPRDAVGPDRLRALDGAATPDGPFAEWLRAICPKAVDVRGLVE